MGARNAEIAIVSRRVRGASLGSLALLLAAGLARAQGDPPPPGSLADTSVVVPLAPVEVSAPRPIDDARLRRSIGFARAYDVTASQGRLRTVADVLTSATGVHVRQFGGVGGFSTVSIRGSSSGQVAVYLDGVPLNSAQFGVVNFADLPIEAIERVEVYRGAAPLGLDSPGGGAIHLVTGVAPGRWARASGGYGSFGASRADLGTGWRRGSTAVLAVGQLLRGRGDFSYVDDNATEFNASDDTLRSRVNNDLWLASATARVEQGLGRLGMSLTHDHLSKDQGTPGIGANPARHARYRTQRDVGNLRLWWRRQPALGMAPFEPPALRLYLVGQRDRFADPLGELTGVRQDNDNRTLRWGSQLLAPWSPGWGQTVELMIDGRREQYAPNLNLPTRRELPMASRDQVTWAAADRWTMARGRASLAASVRRTVTADEFPGGSPFPGALPVPPARPERWLTSWTAGGRLGLVGGIDLKGSVSRLVRTPTFEELFGNVGGVYGNPRARPEDITTRDLGLAGVWRDGAPTRSWRPAWMDVQLSAYRSDAVDLLVYLPNSQSFQVAQNISAARLWGVEWSQRLGWEVGLSADLSWTRQWTRDEGALVFWRGRELPARPRDEGSIQLNYARRGWQIGVEQHLVSANYLDRANLSKVPARALLDAGGALRVPPLEWIVEGRNLTDQHVEDFDGFPLPGRSLFVGMRVRIDRKETPP